MPGLDDICSPRVKLNPIEQWIKEGKNAIKWTRLSRGSFAATRGVFSCT